MDTTFDRAVPACQELEGLVEHEVTELGELQLACAAGGCGEVIFG